MPVGSGAGARAGETGSGPWSPGWASLVGGCQADGEIPPLPPPLQPLTLWPDFVLFLSPPLPLPLCVLGTGRARSRQSNGPAGSQSPSPEPSRVPKSHQESALSTGELCDPQTTRGGLCLEPPHSWGCRPHPQRCAASPPTVGDWPGCSQRPPKHLSAASFRGEREQAQHPTPPRPAPPHPAPHPPPGVQPVLPAWPPASGCGGSWLWLEGSCGRVLKVGCAQAPSRGTSSAPAALRSEHPTWSQAGVPTDCGEGGAPLAVFGASPGSRQLDGGLRAQPGEALQGPPPHYLGPGTTPCQAGARVVPGLKP